MPIVLLDSDSHRRPQPHCLRCAYYLCPAADYVAREAIVAGARWPQITLHLTVVHCSMFTPHMRPHSVPEGGKEIHNT